MSVKIVVPFYPIDIKKEQDYFKICADVTGGEVFPVEGKSFSDIARELRGNSIHAHGRGFPFPEMSSMFSHRSVYTPHFNNIGSRYLTKSFRRLVFNRYEKIIALTEYGRRGLVKDGIDSRKIVVMPIPVDYRFFSKPSGGKSFRKKFNLGNEPFVLASDARDVKNPRIIIDACRKVGVRLVYIGGLSRKELRYEWRVPHKDVLESKGVVFTGRLEPREVLQALDAASVFVNSSKYESFCLGAYEAAASGVPMCLPDIGTFDVFHGSALFHKNTDHKQLANNITIYMEDKNLRSNNSNKAKKVAKEYEYEKVKKLYEEFYERIGYI
jgi:glycosyltransferase involved in cell wall biosynthesis